MNLNFTLKAVTAGVCALSFHAAHADVTIGFSGPLSGPVAAVGQDQYDGFMLGIEHAGGKLGGQAVQVIREDDQLKPEVGQQAVRKLIDRRQAELLAIANRRDQRTTDEAAQRAASAQRDAHPLASPAR